MVEVAGLNYHAVIGSDVQRDGMFLEISDSQNIAVAEVFYSDVDHRMTFTAWKQDLPVEVVEWAVGYARLHLPPRSRSK
jgi:hypothetical protein